MKTHSSLAAALAILAAAAPAQAANIIWSAPTGIAGDSDVSLNGTLVAAFKFLDSGTFGGEPPAGAPPYATVNGVEFQEFGVGSTSNTVGDFTFSVPAGVIGSTVSSSGAAPFANLSTDYQLLLGVAAFGFDVMTLTMGNLTLGQKYEFQAWVNDSRDYDPPGFTFAVDVTAGNTVTLDPNTSVVDGGVGQFVTGTFTADALSQQVTFFNAEVGVVNAFQLRATSSQPPQPPTVPEPGSALVGMLALGLCGARLGRRRA